MSADDSFPSQFFLGNVENVAARDINIFGPMSEWTGLPAEVLRSSRALEVEAFKQSKKKRWSNTPFISMIVLFLILLGISINMLLRFFGTHQGGFAAFSQAAPSISEVVVSVAVFLSLQIAQAMCSKVRRKQNERAALAAKNIQNIDIELRRQNYGQNY